MPEIPVLRAGKSGKKNPGIALQICGRSRIINPDLIHNIQKNTRCVQ